MTSGISIRCRALVWSSRQGIEGVLRTTDLWAELLQPWSLTEKNCLFARLVFHSKVESKA